MQHGVFNHYYDDSSSSLELSSACSSHSRNSRDFSSTCCASSSSSSSCSSSFHDSNTSSSCVPKPRVRPQSVARTEFLRKTRVFFAPIFRSGRGTAGCVQFVRVALSPPAPSQRRTLQSREQRDSDQCRRRSRHPGVANREKGGLRRTEKRLLIALVAQESGNHTAPWRAQSRSHEGRG